MLGPLEIERIRNEISERGESTVSAKELRRFYDDATATEQWGHIAKLAIDEHWTFTFFPDGAIRFAKL